ncbi:MAG: tRNA dihydrouridine synthase [Promethearchaeota archaeon]
MKLGTIEISNRYILAPMQNVTTAPYRRFCRKFHEIGLVSIPMIYSKRVIKDPQFLEYELCKIEEERPISIQLIGSEVDALKKTIEYLESYEFDVLDINAGCPSRRAIKAREGGYLMKDLNLLDKIIHTASKTCSKPVSMKIRTGFDKPVDVGKLAEIINNSGINLLSIHARTVLSKFNDETLDLDIVKRIKEKVIVPVIGNGNIINPITAKHFINYTNVDAFMIGRETMGNPNIFNQIHEYLVNNRLISFKNNREIMETHIKIYENIIDKFLNDVSHPLGNELVKFNELKRNAIWLSKNIDNSTEIRIQISKTKNLIQLQSILNKYFNFHD